MKFICLIWVIWTNVLIEGLPHNYDQIRMQSRSIGDFPVINWFYGSNPDRPKSEEFDHTAKDNDKIKVLAVGESEPKDEPEPVENLLEELKKQEKNANGNDGKIMTLLTNLNKIMTQSSDNLAKIFVNKSWRIFDIGRLGSSRRTRNVQEVNILTAYYYAFISLLNQIIYGTHLGNDTAQKGTIFDYLNPFTYFNTQYGCPIHQNVVGAIAGLPKKNSSDSDVNYIIVINDENEEKVNRLLNGKTSEDILLKIKKYFDKDDLNAEEKFYIVWKLYDLFLDLFDSSDETILKLITLIIDTGEDPRFQRLFEIFKAKNNPKFEEMWKLFKKSKPKLHKKYLATVKTLPDEKIIDLPSRNCFVINLAREIVKLEKTKKKEDRDNELVPKDLEPKNEYYIFCDDDDNESEANRLLEGDSNDDVILKIKKYLDKDDLDPEYAWYIILKSYKMLKNLPKDDKDRSKVIQLIILIGKDPKFEGIFKNLKSKKDPRLQDIWKLFITDSKNLEESIKLPPKKESEHENAPLKNTPDEKITKNEKESKNTEIMKNKPTETPSIEVPENPPSSTDSSKIPYYTGKTEILFTDLEEVEILLKDPSLNSSTRNDIINFIHKWSHGLGNQPITDDKIKRKLDELVRIIKGNREFNNFFATLSSPKIRKESASLSKSSVLFNEAVLDSVIQHIENVLKNSATNFPSKNSMIHLAVVLHNMDYLNEARRRKIDEIIDFIKRNPETKKVYESMKLTG